MLRRKFWKMNTGWRVTNYVVLYVPFTSNQKLCFGKCPVRWNTTFVFMSTEPMEQHDVSPCTSIGKTVHFLTLNDWSLSALCMWAVNECYVLACMILIHTPETVYKAPICPKENLLYKQIYLITDQKLLCQGIMGLWNGYFISDFTLYPVTL